MRVAYRVKPLTWSERDLGRDRQLLPGGDDVDQRRAVVGERRAQRVLELAGFSTRTPCSPTARATSAKFGVVELGAEVDEAGGLHLQLDEGQRAVVEHDDLHRQPLLAEGEQLAEQHRQAAVAGRARRPAGPGWAAWAPIACGSALAIVPWLNEPISRRRPFMRR